MIDTRPITSTGLQGCRILMIEDEYTTAQEIVEALLNAGAEPLGPVPRVDEALRLIAFESRIDAALLDVNLYNELVWPVADELLARHVPLVLATGYDAGGVPPAYAHLPRREKPCTGPELIRALTKALNDAVPS